MDRSTWDDELAQAPRQNKTKATPVEVRSWLNWAGNKLLLIPVGRIGPIGAKSTWQFPTSDDFIGAGYSETRFKPEVPTPAELSMVDEITAITQLIKDITTRRIVNARSLVRNHTQTNLYSYKRLAFQLSLDPKTVQSRYLRGVCEVAEKLEPLKVYRFRSFFSP